MDREEFEAEVDRIAAIPDDRKRMVEAHQMMRGYESVQTRLSDIRHFAARALRDADRKTWKLDKIAEALGLTGPNPRQDAQSILRGRRGLRAKPKPGGAEGAK